MNQMIERSKWKDGIYDTGLFTIAITNELNPNFWVMQVHALGLINHTLAVGIEEPEETAQQVALSVVRQGLNAFLTSLKPKPEVKQVYQVKIPEWGLETWQPAQGVMGSLENLHLTLNRSKATGLLLNLVSLGLCGDIHNGVIPLKSIENYLVKIAIHARPRYTYLLKRAYFKETDLHLHFEQCTQETA